MNAGFAALAGLMVLVAVALVVWPLWRAGATPRSSTSAMVVLLAMPMAAAGLYSLWSNHDWAQPAVAGTPEAMVARLARRLEREPDDIAGWLQLGQSYLVLEQFPLAARAYQRADRLSGGRDAGAVLGWAEALFRENEKEIEGRAGRLFERALELDPNSTKAVLFGAIAAQRRGDWVLARGRFAKVLDAGPPAELRSAIEAQVTQLDQMMAAGPQTAGSPAPVAVASDARVSVSVRLGGRWQAAELASLPLFVLARHPGEPGPPLAVKRLSAVFPQDVDLTAADAMLPGRELVAGDTVEVVARLSRSGAPTATAGDPFGTVRYTVGKNKRINVIIDQITPER